MADDLHMEDLDSINVPLGSTESARSSPSAAHDISDAPTDYSGHSSKVSSPPTPMAADDFNMAPDMPTVQVYHPYDIEEPDDEPDPAVQRLELPSLPDHFEGWQRELIEYMKGLENDPSKQIIYRPLTAPKRGQKRKPSSMSGAGYHSSHYPCSTFKTGQGEEPLPVPGLRLKRRRRRSKVADDSMKAAQSVSLHDFRDDADNWSSSSDPWSTDSSAEAMHESAIADDMDID